MNSAEQQLQQVLFNAYRYQLGGHKSNQLILNVLYEGEGVYYIDYRNGLTYTINPANDTLTEDLYTVINFGGRRLGLYRIDQPPNRLKMRKIWVAGQLIERINYVDGKEIRIKY
jgi:hypothetical protein